MRFTFGKKQVQDFVKVIQFMDKEGIEYEIAGELALNVGPETPQEQNPKSIPLMVNPVPAPTDKSSDPMWRGAFHDGNGCDDFTCKVPAHYGAMPLD